MLRRIVIFMSLIAYLAGTFASMPHAHAGDSTVDHSRRDAKRHLHVSWLGDHGHRHRHDHDGADHRHCDHSHHGDEAAIERGAEAPAGHDQDAAYLPDEVGSAVTTVKHVAAVDALAACNWMFQAASAEWNTCGVRGAACQNTAESSIGCPLFLALRTLRI